MTEAAPLSRRSLAGAVLAGLAWRLWFDSRVDMPSADGVNYLWMAEQFARGHGCDAVGEVFSPLLGILAAIPVAMGMDAFPAAQLVLAICGALAVWPMTRISEHFAPGTGPAAAMLTLFATRSVKLGAEVYTEPVFLVLASWSVLCGVRGRTWVSGMFAAIAFWVRPEAPLIPLAFVIVDRRTWRALVPVAGGVFALALWRGVCGHGFDPVPKFAFILEHNVGASMPLWERVALVPVRLIEAFGAILVFALVGVRRLRAPVLGWTLLLATLVICAYVPRWRFFVNWMFALVPFAAAGVRRLPGGGRVWLPVAIIVSVALTFRGGVDPKRVIERRVGEYLGAQLRPGERIVGNMTRVLYYAGLRPLPPRHFHREEVERLARGARFVVVHSGRIPAITAPGMVALRLPPELAAPAAARGILVFERR